MVFVSAQAQQKVTIKGTVVDDDRKPLELAMVSIEGETMVGTRADLKGRYSLTCNSSDSLVVVFSMVGYQTRKRVLKEPTDTVTLNVVLPPLGIEIGTVEVKDVRRQTNTMTDVNLSDVKHMGNASGQGIEQIIATQAGVSTHNELSNQYNVRGGSFDENSVYINGIEVYRPLLIRSGQQEGLSIINPDMVEKVQFSAGGFDAKYGDKMASVLDITYKKPTRLEASASASMMGAAGYIGYGNEKFSMSHAVRYKTTKSLLGTTDTHGEYDPKDFDYQTYISWSPSKRWTLDLIGNIARNDYNFTPSDRTTKFGTAEEVHEFKVYFDGKEQDKFHTYFGALSLNYKLSRGTDLTLQASGYRTDELVTYDIHGEYWLDEAGTSGEQSVGGELGVGKYHEHERTRLKLNVYDISLKGNTGLNNHNLSYGLTMRRESIYDRSREWQWRDSAGYSLPHVPGEVNVVYSQSSSHDLNTTRFAAYVQDTYKLMTDRGLWSINGGVRVSYWDFNKETLVSPRFSIGFVPERNNRLSLRLAGGLYYQAPFYKEYRYERTDTLGNVYIDLNHNIKSQRSIHAIVGGDYTFRALNRPFKFTTEIYYKNLANLIPYEVDNLKVVYSGLNQSKGYVAGIDLKLFGQFVEGTDSWISFSLMKTQETLNGVKVPRPTDQRYSFALFFTDYFPKLPRLKFSLKAIVSDGLPTTSPRMTRDQSYFRQPAYKRVDVGLSFQLVGGQHRPTTGFLSHFKSIWLGVDVFNLFDISNVSSYYWITDVNAIQYAVPNYLTRRQINARLQLNF